MRVETVTVIGQDGNEMLVNKTDYDANPDKWQLFATSGDPEIKSDVKVINPTPPVAGDLTVAKDGKRFFVVDKDGNRADGYDGNGYATDAAAWTAIFPAGGQ